MSDSSVPTLVKLAALLAILTLSAASMLWLFWHFPRVTAAATIFVLAALGVSARRARALDAERSEIEGGEQSF